MKKYTGILYKYPFLLFTLFLLVAYLPVFLPFFHLKNDLITQNLPTRYIISESLYSGKFPWWNPYIHFGIPQYGDMNNGFWNPFQWLIASTVGYSIRTITIEEMLYILIGGWGMYQLIKEFGLKKEIAIVIGFSYMCCGFITGHLQHFCWITATAFFPYVLLYFLRTHKNAVLKNFIAWAIAVFFFIASSHPGLIIGALYFFIFTIVAIYFFRKDITAHIYNKNFWLINFTFLILSLAFSIVVIISDLDVLRHISRGHKVGLEESLMMPTTLQSYLSLLFPLAVNKGSFWGTDISMRNVFIGIAALYGFIVFCKRVNKKVVVTLALILCFFILLAAGGIIKTLFYYGVPLAGYVRLNGEFSFFVIFILLCAGAFGLNHLPKENYYPDALKKFVNILLIVCSATMLVTLLFTVFNQSASVESIFNAAGLKAAIKSFIDNAVFPELLFINAFLVFVAAIIVKTNYSHKKAFLVFSFHLIIMTWLCIPFTGLGMSSVKQMQQKLSSTPRGLHSQELKALNKTAFLPDSYKDELLLLGSYSKKIGYPEEEQYPVQLNTTRKFYEDDALIQFINNQSFVFLTSDTSLRATTNYDSSLISITAFGAGVIKMTVDNTSGFSHLVFLQNDYPYWKCFVNEKVKPHYTVYNTFIGLPIERGKQDIEFRFEPAPVKKALWINIFIIVAGVTLLFIPQLRNWRIFN